MLISLLEPSLESLCIVAVVPGQSVIVESPGTCQWNILVLRCRNYRAQGTVGRSSGSSLWTRVRCDLSIEGRGFSNSQFARSPLCKDLPPPLCVWVRCHSQRSGQSEVTAEGAEKGGTGKRTTQILETNIASPCRLHNLESDSTGLDYSSSRTASHRRRPEGARHQQEPRRGALEPVSRKGSQRARCRSSPGPGPEACCRVLMEIRDVSYARCPEFGDMIWHAREHWGGDSRRTRSEQRYFGSGSRRLLPTGLGP